MTCRERGKAEGSFAGNGGSPAFLFFVVHLLFPLMAMGTTLHKLQVAHIATASTTTQLSTVQIIQIKERRGQPRVTLSFDLTIPFR
jgi:hypothetical protein